MEPWQKKILEHTKPGRGHKAIAALLDKTGFKAADDTPIDAAMVSAFLAEHKKAQREHEKAGKSEPSKTKETEKPTAVHQEPVAGITTSSPTSEDTEITDTTSRQHISEITDLAEIDGFWYESEIRELTESLERPFESVITGVTDTDESSYVSEVSDMFGAIQPQPDIAEATDIKEPTRASDITETYDTSTADMRSLIRQIVQEEVRQAMENQTAQKSLTPDFELPPRPPKIDSPAGRKIELGDRTKLGISVDAELARLLEKWRTSENRSLGISQAVDAILWMFFGKPTLSHDLPDAENQALRRAGELDAYRKKRSGPTDAG